jgi:hypothetical protein
MQRIGVKFRPDPSTQLGQSNDFLPVEMVSDFVDTKNETVHAGTPILRN